MIKPVEEYTDDELVIELADRIKEDKKLAEDLAGLERVKNQQMEKKVQNIAKKLSVQLEMERRNGKK